MENELRILRTERPFQVKQVIKIVFFLNGSETYTILVCIGSRDYEDNILK